ncbi:MAG: ABC-type transport auxiliary lipoprotein family protein [Hyphomonadaceae bacterium]|nr:ABC-type transport auxiliary lipoprotein family protein [Hyphomonadaceae bacterium]
MMRTAFVVLAAAAASACVTVFPEPGAPPRLYPLEAAPAGARAPDAAGPVVLVGAVTGAEAALGPEIVWRRDGVIAYVDGARWPDAAGALLRDLVLTTVRAESGARAAVRGGDRIPADIELRWDVQAFEIVEENGAVAARLDVHAMTVDARTRAILAVQHITLTEDVETRSQAAAAAALQNLARDAAARSAALIR